jgi:hypothetical protein
MMWAIISRTGDILQLVGLATLLVGAVWGALKLAAYGRAVLGYFKK